MSFASRLVVFAGLLVLGAGGALAQPVSSSAAACPEGNLLAGRLPGVQHGANRALKLVTDGVVAQEGGIWNAPLAVLLQTRASTLTWDLGAVTKLEVAWIQADANDYYTVWTSLDGQNFQPVGRIDPVEGHGLRGRSVALGGIEARYFRFGEGEGDDAYSVSEVQVFCQRPTPFPPQLTVSQAAPAAHTKTIYDYWNNDVSARWELVLAVGGFALLFWGFVLRRDGRGHLYRRLRDGLLAALGFIAAFTYINFGFFHFPNFVHDWEWTHYYIGSKYFDELAYDRLYECIAIADVEDGLKRRVELRNVTNLRNNKLEKAKTLLDNPQACKQHFSAERWADFKHDVAFFRNRQTAKRWDDLQTDHGYNATPVWNVAGTILANTGRASTTQLYLLALLDPLYLLATIGVVWWAFGWRVLSVALLVFATNFPSRFYWTGGSFLRWDWLFYLVAAICCLRKGKPALGGAALAYSTALRVFPLFIFLGPAMGLAYGFFRKRTAAAAGVGSESPDGAASDAEPALGLPPPLDSAKRSGWQRLLGPRGSSLLARLDQRYLRFFAGAALAGAILFPLSLQVSGGIGAYQRFVQNTVKHKETPLTNYMGLRTVMAWRPSEVGRLLKDDTLTDPWINWKQARLRGYETSKPFYILVLLGFLVLVGRAARYQDPWVMAALGVAIIPFGVELTCYYYAFIMGVALLHEKREEVGWLLLATTALTQFFAWAPVRNMSRWLDEQYTAMSAATIAAFVVIAWFLGERGSTSSPEAPAVVKSSGGRSRKSGRGKRRRG